MQLESFKFGPRNYLANRQAAVYSSVHGTEVLGSAKISTLEIIWDYQTYNIAWLLSFQCCVKSEDKPFEHSLLLSLFSERQSKSSEYLTQCVRFQNGQSVKSLVQVRVIAIHSLSMSSSVSMMSILIWSLILALAQGQDEGNVFKPDPLIPGPWVKMTHGAVWPRPAQQTTWSTFFVIDPKSFRYQVCIISVSFRNEVN